MSSKILTFTEMDPEYDQYKFNTHLSAKMNEREETYISSANVKQEDKKSKKGLNLFQKSVLKFNEYQAIRKQKTERSAVCMRNFTRKSIPLNKIVPFERIKERKPTRTTRRISYMPSQEDAEMDDYHYANFLGDKYTESTAYNTKCLVNLNFCDSRVDPDAENVSYQMPKEESKEEEDTDEEDASSSEFCLEDVDEEYNYLPSSRYYDYDSAIYGEDNRAHLSDWKLHNLANTIEMLEMLDEENSKFSEMESQPLDRPLTYYIEIKNELITNI